MIKSIVMAATVVAALGIGAAPSYAQDAVIDGSDPEAIRAIMSGYGRAELTTDSLGDPKIDGRMEGYLYYIDFYGCKENRDCNGLLFRSIFEKQVSLEVVNAWNQEKRYGQAYVNADGTATIAMAVNLRHGVDKRNFDDTADWWRVLLGEFVQHIDFR